MLACAACSVARCHRAIDAIWSTETSIGDGRSLGTDFESPSVPSDGSMRAVAGAMLSQPTPSRGGCRLRHTSSDGRGSIIPVLWRTHSFIWLGLDSKLAIASASEPKTLPFCCRYGGSHTTASRPSRAARTQALSNGRTPTEVHVKVAATDVPMGVTTLHNAGTWVITYQQSVTIAGNSPSRAARIQRLAPRAALGHDHKVGGVARQRAARQPAVGRRGGLRAVHVQVTLRATLHDARWCRPLDEFMAK
eukprot:scaffold55210_cov38-Phaeocystis_antarctica.AAC.1